LDSRPLPAVLQLRPYQQRWIDDPARAVFAVKSARIGFSYATGLRRLLKKGGLLERENMTCTVLSASKPQSVEFVETVQKNLQLIGATAQLYEEPFADIDGESTFTQSRIQLPNGSRYIALAANPRTARGYPGDAVLDEFGHHEDSYAIWAAITRQTALGNELDVLSTPNGELGKYFDLAKELGLTDGVAPQPNPKRDGIWSGHWVDVILAVAEGCPINPEEMQQMIKDADTYAQEFLCQFLKAQGAWLPLELVAAAEDDAATKEWPANYVPRGQLYLGIDVGREGDRTVAWLDEYIGDIAWARMVMPLHGTPFFTADGEKKLNDQAHKLLPWVQLATRTAMDSTGIGLGLYEFLASKVPGRVMGVNFSGSVPAGENVPGSYANKNTGNVKIKTDMAVRLKQNFEKHMSRIPHDPQIRQELMAIKKEYSGGAIKFDAPRIEVDTAVAGGKRKKVYAHADSFWAKAMADLAASGAPAAAFAGIASQKDWYQNQERGKMTRAAREISGGTVDTQPAASGDGRRSLWASR
jgi:phage FluMu gp28-like protein